MAKIMIVDDHSSIIESLSRVVEKLGYEYDTAFNGEDFLEKVESSKPDLVLLDVMMPGLKTKEILKELKKKGLDKLKIILITVVRLKNEQVKELKKECNIVDYITKPFDLSDLMKRVKKQL